MITFALLLFLFTAEIDPKMKLDLDIAEKILSELLRQDGSTTTNVKGSHIPGYGVMLELSYRHISIRSFGMQVAGIDIDERIKRYINDYGDLISGITPDEHISVSYGSRGSANRTIVSVKKRDVSDRRSGKLTEAAFMNRIRSQQVTASPDAEIFAKVVETAVNADTSRVFSLRNVTSSTLPGYGLLVSGTLSSGRAIGAPMAFNFLLGQSEDVDLSQISPSDIESIEVRTHGVRGDSMHVNILTEDVRGSLDGLREEIVDVRSHVERIRAQRRRSVEEMAAAYASLETQFKSVIVDYGRTLNSLTAGETLMVRIANDRTSEGLPQSVTFTVLKSVLSDYDRRAITKDQALSQISVLRD